MVLSGLYHIQLLLLRSVPGIHGYTLPLPGVVEVDFLTIALRSPISIFILHGANTPQRVPDIVILNALVRESANFEMGLGAPLPISRMFMT